MSELEFTLCRPGFSLPAVLKVDMIGKYSKLTEMHMRDCEHTCELAPASSVRRGWDDRPSPAPPAFGDGAHTLLFGANPGMEQPGPRARAYST